MKKLNLKFIASLIAAGIVASAAVSASAADYGWTPHYVPADSSTSTGSTDGATATDPAKNATIIGISDVESAIKNGKPIEVTVDDNGDVIVTEAAIGVIAKGDVAVTIKVSDPNSDTDYEIVIDPALIKEVTQINIAMKITIPTEDKTVDGVEVPAGSVIIEPAQKGDFHMTLEIIIPSDAFDAIDLDEAGLYYVNDGDVEEQDGLTVNKNTVSVLLSHASAYVITDVDLTAGEVEIDEKDDTKTNNGGSSNTGKDDNTVTVNGNGSDKNPITGTTLALGSLAVFAAAAAVTSKKRK